MSTRRVSLPGADELFRATGTALASPAPLPTPSPLGPSSPGLPQGRGDAAPAPLDQPDRDDSDTDDEFGESVPAPPRRRPRPAGERRPTGRERHDEKITVYCSQEELIDLERARLTLRGEHGLAVDRGRIVREALAVVLADLDGKADQSVLVRRLRGR